MSGIPVRVSNEMRGYFPSMLPYIRAPIVHLIGALRILRGDRSFCWYFAYGSNLDWAQIRERCPSTEAVSVVAARGYRLAFTRFSTNRQCGAADILPAPGARGVGDALRDR